MVLTFANVTCLREFFDIKNQLDKMTIYAYDFIAMKIIFVIFF